MSYFDTKRSVSLDANGWSKRFKGLRVFWVLGLSACVSNIVPVKEGVGSFRVEVSSVSGVPVGECEDTTALGSKLCRRPFPSLESPVSVTIEALALDRMGEPMDDFDAVVQVDARPAHVVGVGPQGVQMAMSGGRGTATLNIAFAVDAPRIWVEDCSASTENSTFATGVSEPIYFQLPTVSQLNRTDDNTESPMQPRADNTCALLGDDRYSIRTNFDGELEFTGFGYDLDDGEVYSPPPLMGTYVTMKGCSRAEYDLAQAAGQDCDRGPLLVTGIANEGFFITDLNPLATFQSFNHIYVFNFNYPEDLQLGDIVTELRGGPDEFTGSTQLLNPGWIRDRSIDNMFDDQGFSEGEIVAMLQVEKEKILPKAIHLNPKLPNGSIDESELAKLEAVFGDFGANRFSEAYLERLEGALVCVDNIVMPSRSEYCDQNLSGGLDRSICRVDRSRPLPGRCEDESGKTSTVLQCTDAWISANYCFDLSEEEFLGCGLSQVREDGSIQSLGRIPLSAEYCCERNCYSDPSCSEESGWTVYGQWSGDIRGRFEFDEGNVPFRMSFSTRDARPDFDPFIEGAKESAKDPTERRTVRVLGNLRHALAARPVWGVIARSPSDIEIGGSCDDL